MTNPVMATSRDIGTVIRFHQFSVKPALENCSKRATKSAAPAVISALAVQSKYRPA